jgi:hypothetical protein
MAGITRGSDQFEVPALLVIASAVSRALVAPFSSAIFQSALVWHTRFFFTSEPISTDLRHLI